MLARSRDGDWHQLVTLNGKTLENLPFGVTNDVPYVMSDAPLVEGACGDPTNLSSTARCLKRIRNSRNPGRQIGSALSDKPEASLPTVVEIERFFAGA